MELAQIETQLHDQLQELEQRLAKINADLSQPHSADSQEQALERENDEVMENIAKEAQETIVHIKSALERIADGSYGICETCGEKIALARLQAIPEATQCVECAP